LIGVVDLIAARVVPLSLRFSKSGGNAAADKGGRNSESNGFA
jgi:hypothetical protein